MQKNNQQRQLLDIDKRVSHILEETRIVLPGTQVLLGFQLAAIFESAFSKLPLLLRQIHILSLLCVTVSVVLLMSTSAYNRIVDQNKATVDFQKFATRMILFALIFLGIGLSIEMYVVVFNSINSQVFAISVAVILFVLCMSLWFGYTAYNRKRYK